VGLDPNWFYSTLAQSTAAIVGLAGAFLVQRILAQRSDIAQHRRDLRGKAQGFLNRAAEIRRGAQEAASALALGARYRNRRAIPSDGRRGLSLRHGRGYAARSENRQVPFMDPAAALPLLQDARDAVRELADAVPTTLAELGPMLVRRDDLTPRTRPGLTSPS
jgi:hypothetical protein